MGIKPVKMTITSKEIKYKYCEIDPDIRVAQLLYEYNNRNISYIMSSSYTEELWGTDIEDKEIGKYSYSTDKLNAEITEYELSESKESRYSAEFEFQGVYYKLTGVMRKTEFEKILKKLHFPS